MISCFDLVIASRQLGTRQCPGTNYSTPRLPAMPPRVKPGNPQWIEWVEQAARKAEENGSKAASAYQKVRPRRAILQSYTGQTDVDCCLKAARSLEKCPITFTHPDEAVQLVDVGAGVIKIIMGKLKDHCEQTGEPFPERGPSRLSLSLNEPTR